MASMALVIRQQCYEQTVLQDAVWVLDAVGAVLVALACGFVATVRPALGQDGADVRLDNGLDDTARHLVWI